MTLLTDGLQLVNYYSVCYRSDVHDAVLLVAEDSTPWYRFEPAEGYTMGTFLIICQLSTSAQFLYLSIIVTYPNHGT